MSRLFEAPTKVVQPLETRFDLSHFVRDIHCKTCGKPSHKSLCYSCTESKERAKPKERLDFQGADVVAVKKIQEARKAEAMKARGVMYMSVNSGFEYKA